MENIITHSYEKIVTVNGPIQLNYDTFGKPEDPAILLIMGLAVQMILWKEDLCQALASKGYYVIRFDNRDVGLSTKLDSLKIPNVMGLIAEIQQGKRVSVPYKLIDMAKDTIGLLDALHIESAHIVGASMGGMIAQTIAINFPNRVKTLTSLFSSTGNPNLPPATPEAMAVLLTPTPTERERYIERSVKDWAILQGPKYPLDVNYIKERSAREFERGFYPAGSARQYVAILASGSRKEALKNINIPTLVIHGDADPLIPVEAGRDTAEAISGAELLIIEGMGHSIPDEVSPQIINAIVKHTKKNL